VLSDGTVACWGANGNGELGHGPLPGANVNVGVPTAGLVPNLHDVTSVTLGFVHVCALRSDATVVCWGSGGVGQLGDGRKVQSVDPVRVVGLDGVEAIAAGDFHTCALLKSGAVWCWGRNHRDQLEAGPSITAEDNAVPVQVVDLTDAVWAAAGDVNTCAVRASGEVVCWGDATAGALGTACTGRDCYPSNVPVAVGVSNAVAVVEGYRFGCALLQDHTVSCWGDNGEGQTGQPPSMPHLVTPVAGLTRVVSITASNSAACALLEGGDVRCWGSVPSADLSPHAASPTPVAPPDLPAAVAVSIGSDNACAVVGGGGVMCWGENVVGQLGDGTMTGSLVPVEVTW